MLTAGPFQVFGINTTVPTVLFYDERQPLANFLSSLGFWGKCYLEALRVTQFGGCSDNKIWLDPKKGELCQGPEGPGCEIPIEPPDDWESGRVPCSAELLQDDSCLRFLASCKSKDVDRWITRLIAWEFSAGVSLEVPEVHQPTIFSTLTDATIAVSGGVRYEGGCLGEKEVTENGETRDKGDWLTLWTEEEEEREVWMSQASSVFHQRGVSLDDDLSQYKLTLPRLYMYGHLLTSETTRQRCREKTIYLFVHPLTPSTPMEDCTTSSLHHWSFDPTGQHPLPAEMCKDLGLPTILNFEVYPPYQYCWNNKAYKWMHEYQLARGFNPKTPDFARHLGFPVYQVQSDSNRFEDIDVTTASLTQPPAILMSSAPGDRSSGSPPPNTQSPPLQHTVSTPFDDQNSYPGASATAPITPFYSHTSPAYFDSSSGGFPVSTYPNHYTAWNANLPWSGLSYSQSLPLPIPLLVPPAPYPLPSSRYPNMSEALVGWNITDTSSLKRKERDDIDLEGIAGDGRKRARFAETCDSDAVPHLWSPRDGSSERLENDGVVGLRGAQSYTSSGGMGGPVTQMSKLEDEVRRLREENERLRGTSSGSSRMEELASANNSRKSFWSGRSWAASEDSGIPAFGM
ncbi:hypothetical protein V5O48_014185 [Marasmius crinis-equi]|uniref:PH domain-containing protein n=1 Tax=Marasmius crinis-equi TaxID=585013 RepID=A0ABR3EYD4_9AGAR